MISIDHRENFQFDRLLLLFASTLLLQILIFLIHVSLHVLLMDLWKSYECELKPDTMIAIISHKQRNISRGLSSTFVSLIARFAQSNVSIDESCAYINIGVVVLEMLMVYGVLFLPHLCTKARGAQWMLFYTIRRPNNTLRSKILNVQVTATYKIS